MFGVSQYFYYFVLFKSLGIGYLLGILYLFFRFLRFLGLRQGIAVFIQDVLFCGISSVVVFLLLFEVYAGIIRFYVLAGICIGFLLFLLAPGKLADAAAAKLAKKFNLKKERFLQKRKKSVENESKNN